jgi:opacity protein-like surface antigen
MKKQRTINGSHGLAAAGATLLLAAANGHAQQFTDNEFVKNVYVGMDSGFAFQRNMAMDSSFNGSPGNITFNVGWTLNGNIGYRFSDYFAAELDTGVIWNSINKVGDQNLSGVASAHLAEIPVLPNLVFTYPVGHFKPYAGFGFGPALGMFYSSNIPGSASSNSSYHDTDLTFAYQVEAGLKYSLSDNIDVGLGYKFVGTSTHSWTDNGINLNTAGTAAHILEASFTWRF